MKVFKKVAAIALCLTLTMISSMSVLAADSGSWSFAATPAYTEIPRTINLDYSSKGYTAKITSKTGSSAMNAVIITSSQYSADPIKKISEVGVAVDLGVPSRSEAIITFKVRLDWNGGEAAYNNGTIARK